MTKLKQIAKWVWLAWPCIIVLAIGIFHYELYSHHPGFLTPGFLNKLISALLQIFGVAIVIYSIDQNIGMFRQERLATRVLNWLKSCPLFLRKSVTVNISGVAGVGSVSGTATITAKRKGNSVTERLDELERRLDECLSIIFEKEGLLNRRIDEVRADVNASLLRYGSEVKALSSLLEQSAVGGVKLQLLGLLFLIYSAILGIFI